MKAEVEAYNAEKQKMKPFEVNDDDIIDLNVGGQKLTTTRSTLCQVEGSLLASMFSGRWEDALKRDKDEKGKLRLQRIPYLCRKFLKSKQNISMILFSISV